MQKVNLVEYRHSGRCRDRNSIPNVRNLRTPPMHLRSKFEVVFCLHTDKVYLETVALLVDEVVKPTSIVVANSLGNLRPSIEDGLFDLLISGPYFSDGNIIDILCRIVPPRARKNRILLLATDLSPWMIHAIKNMRIDGIFDSYSDGLKQLRAAIVDVARDVGYWSPNVHKLFIEYFSEKMAPVRRLTFTEQLVLAAIGDGSDDSAAGLMLERMPSSVLSIRRNLHKKLHITRAGDLVRMAIQIGFVNISPSTIWRPGFEALLERRRVGSIRESP